jgi:hypothetical protein
MGKTLAVVGSRILTKMSGAEEKCKQLIVDFLCKEDANEEFDTACSGGAYGPDKWLEWVAAQYNLNLLLFLPDWKTYPKEEYGWRAYFARNRQIVEAADYVLIFWDGVSHGTADDIRLCNELHKDHRIYYWSERLKVFVTKE